MNNDTVTLSRRVTFAVVDCCNCGVLFAIPESLDTELARSHRTFYCPWGHGQSYTGKSDVEKAQEKQRQAEAALQAERDQRAAAERELAKHQQRTKGGVCPCCNRSFVQLARHMKSQHPDFPPERAAAT